MTETSTRPGRSADDLDFTGELWRKGLHLLALVVPLGMALLGKPAALALLVPLALLAAGADVLRAYAPWFNRLVDRCFGAMMRRSERPPPGTVVLNGATWVLVTAALLTWLFPVRIAAPAFAAFMVADAAAALVGRRLGRHPWPGGTRTVEGSLAFLLTGLATLALTPGVTLWTGAVAVLLGTATEALPGPLNDNLRVPLVMATVLFALERFVLGHPVPLF
ncbi:phosphatidate cytidylyltransferase [Rhodocaloribacter litoris]|uniref:phosphatidate cytidylyltransferase n=1 Tax=Rhodocaloribacter litoris TaxID=2558931 RepID=UPI0014207B20|nr:phosphatidate cytidylyltransferase [Rhodocaloribacter litoris]QXD16400.1 phosphatidate cytidylyltransferase [Rhodocaloribacter litoris]